MPSRASRREAILDAAACLVREHGAAHLTLDAVSERARVSKGGLLYHFRNKQALIHAMLQRMEETLDVARERHLAGLAPGPARKLKAHLLSMETLRHPKIRPLTEALLAAGAHDRTLLRKAKKIREARMAEMRARGLSPSFIRVIVCACDGLLLSQLLGISEESPAERRAFTHELLRLVDREVERA